MPTSHESLPLGHLMPYPLADLLTRCLLRLKRLCGQTPGEEPPKPPEPPPAWLAELTAEQRSVCQGRFTGAGGADHGKGPEVALAGAGRLVRRSRCLSAIPPPNSTVFLMEVGLAGDRGGRSKLATRRSTGSGI